MRRLLILLLPVLLLGGCSLFDTDNSEPPAKLVEFKPSLRVAQPWSYDTGVGVGDDWIRLYPWRDGDAIYTVDSEGHVLALDLRKGKVLWERYLELPVTGGINGGEGVLVFGTGKGEVVALREKDGALLWKAPVSSEVMAVSRVALGTVVARTNDGNLHGIDIGTGSVRWQAGRRTPPLSLRGASVPLVTHGGVIAGFDNGKLVALSLNDGRAAWETTIAVPRGRSELERMVDIDGQFVEYEGVVYVATYQGRLAAVNLADGRVLWSRKMSSFMGLTVDGDQVYATDAWSTVWAVDRRTGATLWKQPALRLRTATAPAVVDRWVVVGDYEGYLHWMDKFDGHFVARVRSDPDGIRVPPLEAEGFLLSLGNGGELIVWKIVD